MSHPTARYGFRVVGGVYEPRRLVDPAAAFVAHCAADPRAEPDRECYLSAFRYGADFKTYLDQHQSPKGFAGACWSPYLWIDLDRDDPTAALTDLRTLLGRLLHWYSGFDDDDLLIFFSGGKGFHVGVPLPEDAVPLVTFHTACRKLAVSIAEGAAVRIDTAVYDRVRLLRAPNSRHPKTGLHKRRFTHDEVMGLSIDRIRGLARGPLGFDSPTPPAAPPNLLSDWEVAVKLAAEPPPTATGIGTVGRLNRATLDFIRDGAEAGERSTRLFRAAANLREFAAPADLIHALLTEAALDSGLPPAEVNRQIGSGIAHADAQAGKGGVA